ncbi:MAG: flagellar FlbD family protein [Terriglobia bacterium]
MIQLTRLNKQPIVVNSDLIEFIENAPDTVLTLVTGEKVIVSESTQDILDRIVTFRQRLLPTSLAMLPPPFVLHSKAGKHGESEESGESE